MLLLLPLGMLLMLLSPALTMDAAGAACRLFVTSVMPGLFPYMVLSLLLVSRIPGEMPPFLITLLGWCGGSPTGARLLALRPGMDRRIQKRIALSSATMSPMFLLGTVGSWLDSPAAGAAVLFAVILGGYLTGLLTGRKKSAPAHEKALPDAPASLTFGQAVEQAARTMLLVCGTMVMLRVFAGFAAQAAPWASLPLTTLLEVTTGASIIADLPLPLPLRTGIIAGCTGFGGMAVIMQNRALYPSGLLPLPEQIFWQALHGGISFLLALGVMLLIG